MLPTHHLFGLTGMLHALLSVADTDKTELVFPWSNTTFAFTAGFANGAAAMYCIGFATLYWLTGQWALPSLKRAHFALSIPFITTVLLTGTVRYFNSDVLGIALLLLLAALLTGITNILLALIRWIRAQPDDNRREPPAPEVD